MVRGLISERSYPWAVEPAGAQRLGTPYAYTHMVRRVLNRSLELAGLRRIRFHDLRHTCASTMIANGEDSLAVMKQLRHSSIQQTMDVYGHLFPNRTREAMDRLGTALFGGLDF